MTPTLTQLRRDLRQRRRNLDTSYKKSASQRVKRLIERSGWLRSGYRIAIYLATEEELDLNALIHCAWQRGCKLYLPHITDTRRRTMKFYPFTPHSRLIKHRWGIKQLAITGAPIATRMLDAVLLPVVGFDECGHRLGMGGGFYDRHFAYTRRTRSHRPLLIGVAYACQKVSLIDVQPHDIQLDALLTEQAFIHL